jgi:hypothetical protein
MALRPGGAKSKGSAGEREAADLLRGWALAAGFEVEPTRNLEQVRSGGYDLNGVPGLGIEVKRVEALNVTGWWKQATRQADQDGTTPVLMWRQNRRPWRFKARVWAAVYSPCKTSGATVALEVEMDQSQFRLWYEMHLRKVMSNDA